MTDKDQCSYCNMNTTTHYGTRGKSFGGGYIYAFISNKNSLTAVSGSNSTNSKINFCPMCGVKLES